MQEFVTWLDSLSPALLHGALFVVALVETAFPPFPGDAVTVVCAFALARHGGALPLALVLSSSGSYLGGFTLWAVGRHWSAQAGVLSRRVATPGFARARSLVARRGPVLVMVSRFVPGIRSLILLAAGYGGMPARHVWWALAIAVVAWQTIVVTGGYLLGRSWLRVVNVLGNLGFVVVLVGVTVGYLGWRWARRARASGGADDSC